MKWYGLFKLISGHIGNKLGNTVAKDLKAIEKASHIKWSHADKIKELAEDSELSKSYIKELIKSTKDRNDLYSIMDYLKDTKKVSNLNGYDVGALKRMIQAKFKAIDENALFKEMMEELREKGTSHLDDVTEFINHLV